MRALLAIARLEVLGSWPVFLLAAGGALAVRMWRANVGDEALFIGFAAAFVATSRIVGWDLGSAKRQFLFARPVAWWSVWFGKVAAAVLVSTVCVAVAGVIAWLLMPDGGFRGDQIGWVFVVVLSVATLAGLLIGGIAARSGVAILGLLAGLGAMTWLWGHDTAASALGTALSTWGFFNSAARLASALAVLALVAGAIGHARGGPEPRRVTNTVAVVIWATILVAGTGAAWLRATVAHAVVTEFEDVTTAAALPTGEWVLVEGFPRQHVPYLASRLVHVATRREHRVGFALAASTDGRTVSWGEGSLRRGAGPPQLVVATLRPTGELVARDIGPCPIGVPSALAVPPSGAYLAVSGADRLLLIDTASRAVLLDVPTGPWTNEIVGQVLRAEDDRVLAARTVSTDATGAREVELLDIDIPRRRVTAVRGTFRAAENAQMVVSADRRHLFVVGDISSSPGTPPRDPRYAISEIKPLPPAVAGAVTHVSLPDAKASWRYEASAPIRGVTLLADGRLVILTLDADQTASLIVLDPQSGDVLVQSTVGRYDAGDITPQQVVEAAPGVVALGLRGTAGDVTLLLDAATGATLHTLEGMRPIQLRTTAMQARPQWPPPPVPDRAATPHVALFRGPGPSIVSLDLATGETTTRLQMGGGR